MTCFTSHDSYTSTSTEVLYEYHQQSNEVVSTEELTHLAPGISELKLSAQIVSYYLLNLRQSIANYTQYSLGGHSGLSPPYHLI